MGESAAKVGTSQRGEISVPVSEQSQSPAPPPVAGSSLDALIDGMGIPRSAVLRALQALDRDRSRGRGRSESPSASSSTPRSDLAGSGSGSGSGSGRSRAARSHGKSTTSSAGGRGGRPLSSGGGGWLMTPDGAAAAVAAAAAVDDCSGSTAKQADGPSMALKHVDVTVADDVVATVAALEAELFGARAALAAAARHCHEYKRLAARRPPFDGYRISKVAF